MKELKKLSLKEEIDKQAEKTEKEVRENKEIKDMKVSEDMETSLFSRIQEYEYDKRIKKVYRRKKKRMIIVAFAAVLVLALGSMITGMGSKPYWRVLWDELNGGEKARGIDVENMDSQKTENIDEIDIYKEIRQKLGISAVRIQEKPQNMYLERYNIDEEQRYAVLFYNYNNEIIKYSMYLNDSDSSFGQRETDSLIDEYKIENNGVVINVNEYSIGEKDKRRYVAEFEYRDINYQFKGVMDKTEFDRIIKNLLFV